MPISTRSVSPSPPSSRRLVGAPSPSVATEAELAEAWFEAAPSSTRRSSVPPPPVSVVGEFIGDPLADAWLR